VADADQEPLERWAGAREVVATDVLDAPLKAVKKAGADLAMVFLPGEVVDKFRFRGGNETIMQSVKVAEPGGTGHDGGLARPLQDLCSPHRRRA
jgi:hypothetical protein